MKPAFARAVLSSLAAAALFVSPMGASEPGLAIVGAMVFDGTGAAPVVETVLIVDGRITAVGPKIAIPKGYRTIEARGEALLPGFFDLHTHWTASGSPATTPIIANADLAAGVTTVNDFNAAPESYEARRAWLATLVAPHVNLCGRLSTPGGHGADWADTATTKMVSTPAGARAGVDSIVAYHADCLGEVMTDGWRYGTAPDMTSMNEDALTALVDEAHKNHIPVLTHTVTVTKGAEAGRAKVDVIAHALQDRDIDDATVAAIKAGGSALAPTLAVYEPDKPGHNSSFPPSDPRHAQAMRKFKYALDNTLKLYSAGVPIALGTDGGMPATLHGKAALREMELLVQAGLPASAALVAGTANSARAMGELADRGTIEVGKRADFVLIQGKPWENIADVEKTDRVFVDGKLLFGPGAPPANADLPMPAVKVAALVDDFERTDGRSNLNTLVVTNPDGGLDRTTEILQVVPREGGHALMMTAKMAAKDNATASVVLPLTKGSVAPADLTGYHGVRFELRGDGAYRVSLKGLKGTWSSAPVAGDDGWKSVEVPFASLKPVGEKNAAAVWGGDDLTEIEIVDHRAAGAASWVEIDNVTLY
ncbi:Imidazolonepropionase [Granulicella rosea]|uniref:Imidazolonepropionase n=1 Tax=Granulicella rosea TaxID=474952 RepID=A0A239CXS2_9BACT|nr:amidohydrolase family protein [Granulicella rosea]SNS24857.1 Imidazolonepropionase [Granulicella rosea]